MMKYCLLSLLIFLSLVSCNPKENTANSTSSRTVTLEKLDSVQINYLGNLRVHDLDPISGTVLFEDGGPYSQEIILANFDGTIINSFSKFGDMPDTYGGLMGSMRLVSDNSFLVYGYNGFMTYDFEGNLLSQVKLVDFQPPNYVPPVTSHGMQKSGDRYLYVDQSLPPNRDYSDTRIYEEIHLLNWLYPETGEKEPFIKFPESSIFRNGKHFFRNAWDPVYHLADGRIYVAFGLEPMIYAFEDSQLYSLISTFPLNVPEYRYFKGADNFSSHSTPLGLRFTSAFIENIKKIDEYFLVAYFPGYDNADTEMHFSNKTPGETAAFNAKIKEKYPYRIAILDSIGKLVNDFVPGRLYPQSMMIRNGELWMQEFPDEEMEQDYFRLFKIGLKDKE